MSPLRDPAFCCVQRLSKCRAMTDQARPGVELCGIGIVLPGPGPRRGGVLPLRRTDRHWGVDMSSQRSWWASVAIRVHARWMVAGF
ncbi:MAG: hypothetical protein QOG75_1999 [Mycobacterium sp.]|jgi:hypothetical protein|nr:hypothetical protein [Mycobacterium sp.]